MKNVILLKKQIMKRARGIVVTRGYGMAESGVRLPSGPPKTIYLAPRFARGSVSAGKKEGGLSVIPTNEFLPVCWNARFADAVALKERKEVKTLAPPSLARVFEILLPFFLTFIDFSNIIEIVRVG